MNEVEAIRYLSELEGRPKDGFSDEDKIFIERLYIKLKGKVLWGGCNCTYPQATTELRQHIQLKGMETPKYTLKAGVVLYRHTTARYYTNANLTDRVAQEHLKQCPDDIKFFATYPKDWNAAPGTDATKTLGRKPKTPKQAQ